MIVACWNVDNSDTCMRGIICYEHSHSNCTSLLLDLRVKYVTFSLRNVVSAAACQLTELNILKSWQAVTAVTS